MNRFSRTDTWKGMVALFVLSCAVLAIAQLLGA